jgi:hypothetical protein
MLFGVAFVPADAQTPAGLQLYIDGPTPEPAGTACPNQPSGFPAVAIPPRIDIGAASAANFQAHDTHANGVLLVLLRWDGARAAIVTPTADIDAALRSALVDFAKHITVKDALAGCGQAASLLVIQFDVPSGATRFTQTSPPAKPLAGLVPLASATPAYSEYGPTPDPSGTACPGERDPGRSLAYPKRIVLTPESIAYFHAHNTAPGPAFLITLRLDGVAAVIIPAQLAIDDGTRDALTAFARQVTIHPPISSCARPAGVFIGAVSLTTGDVTLTVGRPPAARPSPSP